MSTICTNIILQGQEEEIARLRTEVSDLARQEATIQDKLVENKRRLEAIDAENQLAKMRIEKVGFIIEFKFIFFIFLVLDYHFLALCVSV
ncbi:unnamed protein product [Protopolystoma xenopodis]|uniref:Uncharacterized protein n=1 Tax=Protopolystoma xenopodis TaxID=117903 RepID=A0A3S5BRS7_9PLAT|nr:unnamed protein product [Protopolystoma xenopodis]